MALELAEDVFNEIADRAGVWGSHDEHCRADQLCRACWMEHYSTRLKQAIERKREEDDLEAQCAFALKQFEEMQRDRAEHPEGTSSEEEEVYPF